MAFQLHLRTLALTMSVLAVAGTIPVLPKAVDAWEWLAARDEPEALTKRHLAATDINDRWQEAFKQALDSDDFDLAKSLLDLAESQSIAPNPESIARYQAAMSPANVGKRWAGDFYAGASTGEASGPAGLAGALTADLSGLGDLRDLVREGQKIAQGEEPDELVLGLAAVGLVATGATIASFGLAAPARGGVTTLKMAARAGKISGPLRIHVTRLARDLIDHDQVRLVARSAKTLDLNAARAALGASIRPTAFREIGDMAGDLARITTKSSARSAQEALALARDPGELRRIARLAETRGTTTRAVVKLFGRAAIVLTASALTLTSWVMAGLLWLAGALFVLAILARRTALFIARRVPR